MKINKPVKKANKKLRVLKLFIISLIFVGIAASIAVVGLNYIENRNFKETFYCVSSMKVNNKIRVVQISDLHNCTFGEENEKLICEIEDLLLRERKNAEDTIPLVEADSRLGWEPSMEYIGDARHLRWKIKQTTQVIEEELKFYPKIIEATL